MLEHVLLGLALLAWIMIEVRHRVVRRRRSDKLATPIARAQELRRCGL